MELSLVHSINQVTFPYLDVLTACISNELFLSILCISSLLIVYIRNTQNRLLIITSVLCALLLHFFITEHILKNILSEFFFRARPYTIDASIHQIGTRYTDSSFPSSHMASTVSILTVYFYFYKRYIPYMLCFIVLMAFSRIHNGMHYPSDIIGGVVLGIFYGTTSLSLVKYVLSLQHHKK